MSCCRCLHLCDESDLLTYCTRVGALRTSEDLTDATHVTGMLRASVWVGSVTDCQNSELGTTYVVSRRRAKSSIHIQLNVSRIFVYVLPWLQNMFRLITIHKQFFLYAGA